MLLAHLANLSMVCLAIALSKDVLMIRLMVLDLELDCFEWQGLAFVQKNLHLLPIQLMVVCYAAIHDSIVVADQL